MSERFSSPESISQPPSPELKHAFESLEDARGVWIENIQRLDETIPHDDVIVDAKTIAYNVARNAFLANLVELDELEEALRRSN
jgi:hypothetical protein